MAWEKNCLNFLYTLIWVVKKKTQTRIWKFFFQLSNLSQLVFVLKNPTHWGLETTVSTISAKPVLDIFEVCSLVTRINLSYTQQSYLCPKNQNYLLGKADLGFFFNYRLRSTIKITIFSTYVIDFSSCYSWNWCKKIQTLLLKLYLRKNET